ncbi:Gas vesicle protein GcpK [Candidatus Nitrosotalea okcheonensis]|uniref:Gas vesicle protein GcpK n=2 Tax=Candidatus Nitrosotalea okcheonensis TaxID=1903276 RepID=A0A2H1FFB1_9ARCH|nr:Gas vesicle protein GcpK [Candidatus Nitrosotalea okcheonensis]
MQISEPAPEQINLDSDKLQKGLAKLVLVVVELLRQILERQAQRRIQSGSLTSEEVERLGMAFMQIKQKVAQISDQFGLKPDELDGTLKGMLKTTDSQIAKTSLVDVLDSLLVKGVVLGGSVTVSVADIDLITLDLLATLSAIPGTRKTRKKKNG